MEDGTIRTDELPDLDDDPDTVTVETDMFSVYALVYTEEDPGENERIAKGVQATGFILSGQTRFGELPDKIGWMLPAGNRGFRYI